MYTVTLSKNSLPRNIKFESIFALPEFVELEARGGEKACFYVEIKDANARINCVIPVIISKLKLGLRVASCPVPPQVIGVSDKVNNWKGVLNTLIRYLKEDYKCIAVLMKQRPHDPQFIRGNLNGCRLAYSQDIMIDLSKELRTIYYNVDKRHRYTLRKASGCSDDELLSGDWLQKTGFTIRQGRGEESLHEFRALWVETFKRMYESFNPLRKLLYRDPLTLNSLITVFNKLYPHGLVKLFTIYDEDGKPGASAIFYISNNFTKTPMAYWSAGASSEEGRRKGLPALLQWYVIQWFKEHGYQRYYMGGYDFKNPGDGPSLFKRGFGGRIVSGLTVTWLAQPLSIMRDIAYHTASLLSVLKAL